jgi:Tol biopolymer transport system component
MPNRPSIPAWAAVLIGALAVPAVVAGQTTLMSAAAAGGAAGGASGQTSVAISGDGRYVAFESAAANLVAGDTNGATDVFLVDRLMRTTTRVSVATGGAEAMGGGSGTFGVAVSGDGRVVAFDSAATNLVAGDTNALPDIFVHDRATGTTTRVSVATGGGQGTGPAGARSQRPALSADGRFVAFSSELTSLVPGDTNGKPDVFVHDRATGTTTRVSVANGGGQTTGETLGSIRPALSADGRVVAFISDAVNLVPDDTNNVLDAFVHDRVTGETTRVSVRSAGVQATGADTFSVAISGDGRYAAFDSEAAVVTPDGNGDRDVFVHDRVTTNTSRVSVATGGAEANGPFGSRAPAISSDGRFIAFASDATDLVAADTNGASDVFVHDQVTGRTIRVSLSPANAEPTAPSGAPPIASGLAAISADGRIVAFSSTAANLAPGDGNQLGDVFVRDTRMFLRGRISLTDHGGQIARPVTGRPALSRDGWVAAFTTDAPGIVATDINGRDDVFVHDVNAADISRASVASGGLEGGGGSGSPAVNEDGRLVAFESPGTAFVANDTNGRPDVFVHDRGSQRTSRVSVASGGGQAAGTSRFPALSADGRVVAFVSDAPNLVSGDTNLRWDVFVHDRVTTRTTRVSVASGGRQAAGDPAPSPPALSADGTRVAFASTAPDLVRNDTNGDADIFVHDVATRRTSRLDLRAVLGGRFARPRDPALSGDGRFVAFAADRTSAWAFGLPAGRDILVADLTSGQIRVVTGAGGVADRPALDGTGRHVAYERAPASWVTVPARNVFVHDRVAGTTSVASLGDQSGASGSSMAAAISGDGRVVVYRSSGAALVPNDTNGVDDVFVRVVTPVISDVAPRTGPAAGGTTLQITGAGFDAGTTVTIGGVAAASVMVVDGTRLDIVTPPLPAGQLDIVVVVPGFDAERLAYAFTVQP